MTTEMTSIEIRDLFKIFGSSPERYVDLVKDGMSKVELGEKHGHILGLQDIDLSMSGGKIHVIMGLSGSGKSTLIRHVNRLIEPTAGSILIDGNDILTMSDNALREFRRSRTAMVFQKFALLPHRTVIDNTMFGLEVRGIDGTAARKTAMHWIERVGLRGFESRYPDELSGGMQQRVGLARALSNDASILLMDEAYSALDPLIRTDMQTMLLDLQNELKKTIVFITHDLDEALRLGDQIAILRDGAIVQTGDSQDILLRPADDYIRRFVKDVNHGRFIKVESIMRPPSVVPDGNVLTVPMGTTLGEAAREMSHASSDVAVVLNASGKPEGVIGLRETTTALSAAE